MLARARMVTQPVCCLVQNTRPSQRLSHSPRTPCSSPAPPRPGSPPPRWIHHRRAHPTLPCASSSSTRPIFRPRRSSISHPSMPPAQTSIPCPHSTRPPPGCTAMLPPRPLPLSRGPLRCTAPPIRAMMPSPPRVPSTTSIPTASPARDPQSRDR